MRHVHVEPLMDLATLIAIDANSMGFSWDVTRVSQRRDLIQCLHDASVIEWIKQKHIHANGEQ